MFCTNCGKNMPDDARVCTECGQEMEYYFPVAPAPAQAPVFQPAQPEPAKPKKMTGVIITIVVAAVLMVSSVTALLGFTALQLVSVLSSFQTPGSDGSQPSDLLQQTQLAAKYDAAQKLMDSQKYDEAMTGFQALGDYLDSRAKAKECAYLAAGQYLDNGNYTAALRYMDLMNETQKNSIFDRYYAEFCADEKAKADLYRAIEAYYHFLNSQVSEVNGLVPVVSTVASLLKPYAYAHFHDSQLKALLLEYHLTIEDLLSASMTDDILPYLEVSLRLHLTIDQIHAEFNLLEGSEMLPVMSVASENLQKAIGQHKAGPVILESLATNFYELLQNTEELPYDPELGSCYLDVYNSTIYNYTLSYQIAYYDQDSNLLQTSQPLTQFISGAYYTRVPMPIDSSFDWAYYDVTYQPKDIVIDVTRGPNYAVRLVDEQGNPIYNAYVTFHLGDEDNWNNSHMSTTDRYGIARLYLYVQEENFRVFVNHNPDFIHDKKTYEYPADGRVYDVVVMPAAPDFSVTVVDIDGDPIPGVTMHLATTDVFTASKYGKTDENGYVCWYDVDMSHTYKISGIDLFGFEYIEEVVFQPGQNHITVVMERKKPVNETPSYIVTVVDSEGNPIPGVVLYITISDASGGQYYGKTDENGNAYWYDMDLNHTYKIVLIRKDGYICPEEVHFEPGEYDLIIVLEKESDT